MMAKASCRSPRRHHARTSRFAPLDPSLSPSASTWATGAAETDRGWALVRMTCAWAAEAMAEAAAWFVPTVEMLMTGPSVGADVMSTRAVIGTHPALHLGGTWQSAV